MGESQGGLAQVYLSFGFAEVARGVADLVDDLPALLTRHLIGEENLMWGSDYPHTDSTWPCSIDVLQEIFKDFGDTVKTKITHDNVKNLYQI